MIVITGERTQLIHPSAAYSLSVCAKEVDYVKVIEDYYNVSGIAENRTRKTEIRFARQLAIWFLVNRNLKDKKGPEYKSVKKIFPYNHATLLHSYKVIENYLETDPKRRKEIEEIQQIIAESLQTISQTKTESNG